MELSINSLQFGEKREIVHYYLGNKLIAVRKRFTLSYILKDNLG